MTEIKKEEFKDISKVNMTGKIEDIENLKFSVEKQQEASNGKIELSMQYDEQGRGQMLIPKETPVDLGTAIFHGQCGSIKEDVPLKDITDVIQWTKDGILVTTRQHYVIKKMIAKRKKNKAHKQRQKSDEIVLKQKNAVQKN